MTSSWFYNSLLECDEPAIECLNGYRLKKMPLNYGEFKTPIGGRNTERRNRHYISFYGSTLRLVQQAANEL
jgi:hypothetical protein